MCEIRRLACEAVEEGCGGEQYTMVICHSGHVRVNALAPVGAIGRGGIRRAAPLGLRPRAHDAVRREQPVAEGREPRPHSLCTCET